MENAGKQRWLLTLDLTLPRVLPAQPHFAPRLKDHLDSMIAAVPFSLNPLGFQVHGHYPGEISYSDSQCRDSEKLPTAPSSAIINKGKEFSNCRLWVT